MGRKTTDISYKRKKKILKIDLPLTKELFHALLEGKKLCIRTPDYELDIYPPHYGVFLTNAQIEEIRDAAIATGAKSVFDLLNKYFFGYTNHGN